MPKHSQNKILRIQKDISQLMQQGKSSQEIMDLLHIPLRSYRRYTAAINKQNQKAWYSLVRNELATQLLALRDSIEETFTKSRELANTPGLGTADALAALNSMNSSRLSIVQLLVEGTELLSEQQQQVKYHKVGQNKLAMQPHP